MARRRERKASRDIIPEDFGSVEAAAEFWDKHDLTDYEDVSEPVEFEIDIQTEEILVALDPEVSSALELQARRRRLSPETLANLWLQERLAKSWK